MTFKQGPEKGEPRGYCFVEYSTREASPLLFPLSNLGGGGGGGGKLMLYCHCIALVLMQQAERAKAALNGKKALRRRVAVEWARPDEGAKKGVSVGLVSE